MENTEYKWLKDGDTLAFNNDNYDLPIHNGETLLFSNLKPEDAGLYQLIAVNPDFPNLTLYSVVCPVLVRSSEIHSIVGWEDEQESFSFSADSLISTPRGYNRIFVSTDYEELEVISIDSLEIFSIFFPENWNGITSLRFELGQDSSIIYSDSISIIILPVNDPPTISSISDTVLVQNETLLIDFKINDIDDNLDDLKLQILSSSNQDLIPITGMVFEGSDSLWTLQVTPSIDEIGLSTIELIVLDTANLADTASFNLEVILPTRTNRNAITKKTNLFPNPVKSGQDITLQVQNKELLNWEITTLSGKQINGGTSENHSLIKIHTNKLKSGTYLINLDYLHTSETFMFIVK